MQMNPLEATDFYKVDHRRQYPEGTTFVYSNFTPRSVKHFKGLPDYDGKVVVFGISGVVQWLFNEWGDGFFYQTKDSVIRPYKELVEQALNIKDFDVSHIEDLHDLGYLPILIRALPEGIRVPAGIPHWTIESTNDKFSWITNYLETQLSAETWPQMTSATTAFEFKRLLTRYAKLTGVPLEFVQWQGHDFSFRGVEGIQSAARIGAGHLTSFFGTDTLPAIRYVKKYYNSAIGEFVGGSVPATEHSVMCMGGDTNEFDTIKRLITEVYPSGIVSVVSDTWDFWHVLTDTAVKLKSEIMNRDGKVVFRPDSGDPAEIICGTWGGVDKNAPNEMRGAVELLWEIFGGTINDEGYKVLDPHVGLIYGDGINLTVAQDILERLKRKGFASSNIVFGVGSYTYQFVTRDTLGTAIKATFGTVNGVDRELFKDPVTDKNKLKKSAKGLLRVEFEDGNYVLHESQTREEYERGLLQPIYSKGVVVWDNLNDFSRIRSLLQKEIY